MSQVIPALPVAVMGPAIAAYEEGLGFTVVHASADFAVLQRDRVRIHLWLADDASWSARGDLAARPVRSGAESFLAGTASCRIEVEDRTELATLFGELQLTGRLHPVSRAGVVDTDYGAEELHAVDADGNLITFVAWRSAAAQE